jgi:RNA processing factor Prp31
MEKKVIKLKESDLEKLVLKILKEEKGESNLPRREMDRKASSFRRSDFEPYPREKELQNVFGKYSEELPPNLIQHMRKNPETILTKLIDIYGKERVLDIIYRNK